MRTFALLLVLMIAASFVQAQETYKAIHVKGKITDYEKNAVAGCYIRVWEDKAIIKTFNADGGGNYDMTLEPGKNLILEYGKPGKVSKRVSISTIEVTQDELKYGLFPIVLDLMLFNDFPGLDISPMQKPVAKISFSDYEGDFVHDQAWAAGANAEVEKVKASLDELMKNAYDKEVADGDRLLASQKYEEAWLAYNRSLMILPGKEYPTAKINEIKKIIQGLLSQEEAYKRNVFRADKNYEKKNYKTALGYYEKSLLHKPDEKYPKDKIIEINDLLNKAPELLAINESDVVGGDIYGTTVEQDSVRVSDMQDVSTGLVTVNQNLLPSVNMNQIQGDRPADKNGENQNNQFVSISGLDPTGLADSLSGEANRDKIIRLNNMLKRYTGENDIANQIAVYQALSKIYYSEGKFDKALQHLEKANQLVQKLDAPEDELRILELLGEMNRSLYRYSDATGYYDKAAELALERNDIANLAKMYQLRGDVNVQSGDLRSAESDYLKCLGYRLDYKPGDDVSSVYNSLGVVNLEMGKTDVAKTYFEKSSVMAKQFGNNREESMSWNNLGNVSYEKDQYSDALGYYDKSVDLKVRINYQAGLAVTYHNIGNVYRKTGEYKKALDYYRLSNEAAIESGYNDVVYKNYKAFSDVYLAMKDCNRAMEFFKLYMDVKHLIMNNSPHDQINETIGLSRDIADRDKELAMLREEMQKQKLLAMLESQKKAKEIEYLSKANELKNLQLIQHQEKVKAQRLLLAGAGIALLVVVIFALLFYSQYRAKRRANIRLAEQNEEILSQKEEILSQRDEIASKNTEITDSIRYASRIQQAVQPGSQVMSTLLPDSFVLNKPRNIVSGDFFWVWGQGDKTVISVADCTGHGVPGAFMSMLGISFLNQIVADLSPDINNPSVFNAAEFLNRMRTLVIGSLHQTGQIGEARDGMDMSVCILDKSSKKIQYAGANTTLLFAGSNGIEAMKGDRMPVSYFRAGDAPFTNHELQLGNGMSFYMFTDGVVDQFGGSEGKKFRIDSLKGLISGVAHLAMSEQQTAIIKAWNNWQGSFEQTDDVMMVAWRYTDS